jgi:transposase
MPDRATWVKRIAEWRASGLTSPVFCKGRPFTPGGLRYWASVLGREERREAAASAIRLGRVLRRPAPAPEAAASPAARETPAAVPATDLMVECGAVRVAVRPGFDRATFAAVLDVIAAREGRR